MIRILGTAFAALMGLAFGSFLNVCLTRWPAGESIVKPRSHCRNCGRTLAWWENVPLVSWLALRGRCRTCGTWIGCRYSLVELTIAVLWAWTFWNAASSMARPDFQFSSQDAILSLIELENGLATMILLWALVGLAVSDLEGLWLPNFITLPGIALGIIFRGAFVGQIQWFFLLNPWQWALKAAGGRLIASILAAGLILLIRWIYKLIRHREGLGLGDAKLMAMLAAWLGLPGALLSFAIGVVLGSLTAIVLLARSAKSTAQESWATTKLPLGTFLCIGGIVTSLWGQPIIAAYLRWAGF